MGTGEYPGRREGDYKPGVLVYPRRREGDYKPGVLVYPRRREGIINLVC